MGQRSAPEVPNEIGSNRLQIGIRELISSTHYPIPLHLLGEVILYRV